jgi:hypothetical protein
MHRYRLLSDHEKKNSIYLMSMSLRRSASTSMR